MPICGARVLSWPRFLGPRSWQALAFALVVVGLSSQSAISQPPQTDMRPGQFVDRGTSNSAAESIVDFQTEEPFSATFTNAEIGAVANFILGDFLKIDYTIAPDVSGVISLRVDNVQSRLAGIEALRNALQPLGIAVIDRGDVVAIARGSGQDGPVRAGVLYPGESAPGGVGIVVLTPRHILPSQLAPLVGPFANAATLPVADDKRRLLVVKGDTASINAISNAAALFDVDWFNQVSVATFDLKAITPNDLANEIYPLLGPSTANVDLIPVPRLSRLIVLARSPQMIPVVRQWIERLDVPSATISPGLLVYRARNMSAEALATAVKESSAPTVAMVGSGSTDLTGARSPGASPQAVNQASAFGLTQGGQSVLVSSNLSQNAVIVRGDSRQLAEAKALLEALDQPPPQVLIEAAIVEISLDNELQYGINWKGIEKRFTGTFTDASNGQVTSNFPGFALTYVNTDIEAALNLLSSITKVEVVSRPSVLALNNETAKLQVGDQVPIVTQTAISVTDPDAPIVNQTTYRDTGVILSVTPRVRAGGAVELEVEQEVSQVARTTSSGIDSPTIQQRRIESKLLVPSGRSVALGGLISTSRTGGVSGIPLLMDIPLLGQLFRSDTRIVERTELVVFVTPRVLTDGQAAVDATDQLRAAFRKLEEELARR